MCTLECIGKARENSVFGVLKTANVFGPHRLIFAGDNANRFFAEQSGKVELPNLDVLSKICLAPGQKLYLSSADISQCYNRLRVPEWLRAYLGMPRVLSTEVGVSGKRRFLVPVLRVLPMGIIPAVRLCQEVATTLCKELAPSRVLTKEGPFEISESTAPLDVIYLDDINKIGTNLNRVNARSDALCRIFDEAGLPTEPKKRSIAVDGVDGEALGLCFSQDGHISATPAYFAQLRRTTESLLSNPVCSPRHLAHVVGSWVYACLLRRPTLSVLASVYNFIQKGKYDQSRPLPAECLRELFLLLDLAPILCCDVSSISSERVYATDASPTGSGVTYLDTAAIPVQDLAVLEETAVRKGWQKELIRLNTESEGSRNLQPSVEFRAFFDKYKFHVAIASRWKHKGHINTFELEALLLAVRHARRSSVTTLKRVQFGLDSTVALGVARKGRSLSPKLNWVARKLCAQLLLGGIYPSFFWIPTKSMPADEPSRR